MHVCMHVCMYVLYVCVNVRMHVCLHSCMYDYGRDGLVFSVSASHLEGRVFASRSVIPTYVPIKDHHRYGKNCLRAWHACVRVGV